MVPSEACGQFRVPGECPTFRWPMSARYQETHQIYCHCFFIDGFPKEDLALPVLIIAHQNPKILYKAIVLSTLLYAVETRTLHAADVRILEHQPLRCQTDLTWSIA